MDFWGKSNNTAQPGATTPPADKPASTQSPTSAQTSAPAVDEPKKDDSAKTDDQAKSQWDLPKADFSPTGLPDTSSDDNSDFSYAKKESIDDDITVDAKETPASENRPLDPPSISDETPKDTINEDSGSLTKPEPAAPSKTTFAEEKPSATSATSIDDLESKIKSQQDELQTKIDKLSDILDKIKKLRTEEQDVISQASAIIE